MTLPEWREAAAHINVKWDRMPLDPMVADAWFADLERFDYQDVMAAIAQLVRERPIRPQLPDLLAAIRAVVAGKPEPLALPEPRAAGVPAKVSDMVDTILQRQHKQRESLPDLRVVGHDYRPSKPLQVERTEPLDSLQRWLSRHYVKDMRLTCAACSAELHVGDLYQVTSPGDDLVHAACAALVGATA